MKNLVEFIRNDEGAAMIEYALLVGLIALIAIGAISTLGGAITGTFTSIGDSIDTAINGPDSATNNNAGSNTGDPSATSPGNNPNFGQ